MGYRNFRIVGGETMDLKFNEYGELILPPQKPVLDKSGWVRMTRQRWAKIKAHEEAMEKWTVEKAKYDAIPPCTQTGMEAKIEFYRSRGKLLRNHGGIVLFDVDCIDHETEERIAETHVHCPAGLRSIRYDRRRRPDCSGTVGRQGFGSASSGTGEDAALLSEEIYALRPDCGSWI